MILCLHGATKISHRARGLSSVGSRWHALVTCNSNEAPQLQNLNGNMVAQGLPINFSGSDLDSIDDVHVPLPVNTQLVSYMYTYQKRQAFGMYFQLPTPLLISSSLFVVFFRHAFQRIKTSEFGTKTYILHYFITIYVKGAHLKINSDFSSNFLSFQYVTSILMIQSQNIIILSYYYFNILFTKSKRLGLAVSYLESNTGGFSIFGWIVDRTLVITLLFVELSLILFVLGKTVSYSTT